MNDKHSKHDKLMTVDRHGHIQCMLKLRKVVSIGLWDISSGPCWKWKASERIYWTKCVSCSVWHL